MEEGDDTNYGNVAPEHTNLHKETKGISDLPKSTPGKFKDNEKWQQVEETNDQIKEVISDLDVKLNRVLAKQEYEYLKGYNIYVKKKEKELRQLIDTLNKKNSTSNTKDQKINELNATIQRIRDDQMNLEKMKEKQRKETLKWKSKAENLDEDCKFLQKQVKETKKQNQLLKLAITRLQFELESKGDKEGNTFLTEAVDENTNMKPDEILEILKSDYIDANQLSILEKSNLLDTSANSISLQDISKTKMSLDKSALTTGRNLSTKRRETRSPVSNYHFLPTQNIKYEAFLDMLFNSSFDDDRKKQELKLYMQAVETRFNCICKDLRAKLERERKKRIQAESIKVNEATNKNELETIFVDCIEEVRKDIMKRRLKTEIQNKKRFKPIDKDSEEAKEFEESLLKLAQLAKNKIKISEFTPIDRCNLLDLFVNNEKTLLKIYEACFPHRTNNFTDPNQAMADNSAPQSRPAHQKQLSMGDFSRTEFNDNYKLIFGAQEQRHIRDNSFYGSEIEPLAGFENPRRLTNVTVDEYAEPTLHTILPTIRQHKQAEGARKERGFTKPSTLGSVSAYGRANK